MALENKGVLVVVSAPSGCGKDTVIADLKKRYNIIKQSVSATTRDMREGEKDGVDYFFTTVPDFEKKISEGYFLEYVKYGYNYYGTPKKAVDEMLKSGQNVLLKIEVEGAENIRKIYPDAVTVFIAPPSFDELKKRLLGRGTETEADFNKRVEIARKELLRAGEYDYIVVNDVVEKCTDEIAAIIEAESHKSSRLSDFIGQLNTL